MSRRHRTLSEESSILAMQEAHMNLAEALKVPEFQTMREQQQSQRDRFGIWDQRHKTLLRKSLADRKLRILAEFDRLDQAMADQVS